MKGTLVGLGAVGIWCITTVLVAYVTTLPPLELIALTSLLGFITMTILQLCNGEDIASYWFQPLKYYVFWLGTAGLYTILIFTSYSLVPLFEANILNHTWPGLLIIFTAMLHNERVTAIQIFGGVLGFAGVVAVFMPTADVPLFGDFHFGHALAIGSASLWAAYSAFAKKVNYPIGFLAPVFLAFSLISFSLHAVFEPTVWPSNFQWGVIFMLGFTRVSYLMWDYGMKHGDVVFLASICYFLPLATSLLLAAFGFGPATPMIGIGAALIAGGCLIVNYENIKILLQRRAS
ncbi:MAG: EamA family transporter [Micavibrio sp.]|nr:EamA family transporter [Micavibrio sp.]